MGTAPPEGQGKFAWNDIAMPVTMTEPRSGRVAQRGGSLLRSCIRTVC